MQCIVFEKDQELGKERSSCQHCGVSAPSSGKGVGSSATSFSRATVCVPTAVTLTLSFQLCFLEPPWRNFFFSLSLRQSHSLFEGDTTNPCVLVFRVGYASSQISVPIT